MSAAKQVILQQIHSLLLKRGENTCPHPDDLAAQLKGINVRPDGRQIVELIIAAEQWNLSTGQPAIFKISQDMGYDSPSLTARGRATEPRNIHWFIESPRTIPHLPAQSIQQKHKNQGNAHQNPNLLSNSDQVRAYLSRMDPYDFEGLVAKLLTSIGMTNVVVTPGSGDGGIDIRAAIVLDEIIQIPVSVQVKRYATNISPSSIRQLRGSLEQGELGIFATLSSFTPAAKDEAGASSKNRIILLDGDTLIRIAKKYGVL